jgi:hypothetical protein
VLLAGCGMSGQVTEAGGVTSTAPVLSGSIARASRSDGSVRLPAPWRGKAFRPDLLVVSDESLSAPLRERVRALSGVRAAIDMSVASTAVAGRSIATAAVDPASYRRFTPQATAVADAVWHSVAMGEVVLTHDLGNALGQSLGSVIPLGAPGASLDLRVGAYAVTVPRIDAVVNRRRGDQLGMKPENAMLVSVSSGHVNRVAAAIEELVGGRASVVRLTGPRQVTGSWRAAYLTGSQLGRLLGSFTYQPLPNGFVKPDPLGARAHPYRIRSHPRAGHVSPRHDSALARRAGRS